MSVPTSEEGRADLALDTLSRWPEFLALLTGFPDDTVAKCARWLGRQYGM